MPLDFTISIFIFITSFSGEFKGQCTKKWIIFYGNYDLIFQRWMSIKKIKTYFFTFFSDSHFLGRIRANKD